MRVLKLCLDNTKNVMVLMDIWLHRGFNCDMKTRDTLKDRLQDQFRQEWSSTMEASTKCVLYRNFKIKFELKHVYLDCH